MFPAASLLALSFLAAVNAQQAGTLTAETHPPLTWETCTAPGSCTSQTSGVVLDSNWRWLHSTSGSTNCYTGNQWDAALCPDPVTCATNCALDGAAYASTYGITTSGDALTLGFVTGSNVGSRNYLMAPGSTTEYQLFKPLNREFTFDVDASKLPCGLNGAVYFSEMDADGGVAKYPANKAGAKYGTGYCDSQCPMDLKFINGQANMMNWTATSANSGDGTYGACCNEMDIWEANSISTAYTAHPCSVSGLTQCSGSQCSIIDRHGGLCDPDGCDFNSYRLGDLNFYGPGMTIDTTKPVTVVTQFITSDGTDTGTLSAIKRIYVQNGIVYQNSMSNIAGVTAVNDITDAFCVQQKTAFGDTNVFTSPNGGLTNMGKAFSTGMVLVLSIWDDYAANMLWLDSDYPTTSSPSSPGVARGTCATTSGVPATVEQSPAQVIYSNIKFGPIGSTYSGTPAGGGTTTTGSTTTTKSSSSTSSSKATTTTTTVKTTTASTTTTASGATQTHYGQCGGTGYTGPTVCASPYTCQYSNAYYSQCL